MAYRLDQNPITGKPEMVVDGFEQGIAESPEQGIADMRNINNDSIPGVALANYALKQVTQTPISASTFNVYLTGSTGIQNVGATSLIATSSSPVAIVFTGSSLPTGLTATDSSTNPTTNIYYAVLDTGNKYKVYTAWDPYNGVSGLINFIDSGASDRRFYTVNMGQPKNYTVDNYYLNAVTSPKTYPINYVLDSNGRVWAASTSDNIYAFLGGTGWSSTNLTNASGNGIVVYRRYLLILRNAKIDAYGYLGSATPGWTDDWKSLLTTSGIPNSHYAKVAQNDITYYCDRNFVNSISQSGDMTDLATYTQNTGLLQLPTNEVANYLEEPSIDTSNGSIMYIGTSTSQYIYPWELFLTGTGGSTTYNAPLCMPEIGCYKMLNINKIVYILAGQRGNVYYTDGSRITLYKKVPSQPTGTPYGVIYWGGIMSLNNNLCFGASETPNGTPGVASGCWAVTLTTGQLGQTVAGAIRYKGLPSCGLQNTLILIPTPVTYLGGIITPTGAGAQTGIGYSAGWYNGTYGGIDILDLNTPSFYSYGTLNSSPGGSYFITDIIPIGTAWNPKTINEVEAKLDTPLISGEQFRISMRSNLTSNFTQVFEQTTAGAIDGKSDDGISLPAGDTTATPPQGLKWVQFKAEIQSISGGSFVRLKEIRFR